MAVKCNGFVWIDACSSPGVRLSLLAVLNEASPSCINVLLPVFVLRFTCSWQNVTAVQQNDDLMSHGLVSPVSPCYFYKSLFSDPAHRLLTQLEILSEPLNPELDSDSSSSQNKHLLAAVAVIR